jgi:hypothetical protein
VVTLRVEIDLLELDHEALRTELLHIIKEIRELESEGRQEQMKSPALAGLMLGGSAQAIAKEVGTDGVGYTTKKVQDAMNTAVRETFEEEVVKARASRDRKRSDYARQAAQLAEKRLDLVGAERSYDAARFAGRECRIPALFGDVRPKPTASALLSFFSPRWYQFVLDNPFEGREPCSRGDERLLSSGRQGLERASFSGHWRQRRLKDRLRHRWLRMPSGSQESRSVRPSARRQPAI